uniref:Uncharacterized protein n=2 Tax=viral metagenome TaxID=1070528 RepID=A0A6M3JBG9_9ZZZZ
MRREGDRMVEASRWPFWDWLIREAKKPENLVYISNGKGGYDPLYLWLERKKERWEEEMGRRMLKQGRA